MNCIYSVSHADRTWFSSQQEIQTDTSDTRDDEADNKMAAQVKCCDFTDRTFECIVGSFEMSSVSLSAIALQVRMYLCFIYRWC